MVRNILSKEQVAEIVYNNRIKLSNSVSIGFINSEILAIKTAEAYGFEVDQGKLKKITSINDNSILDTQKQFEGAVLQIRGEYSVNPDFELKTDTGFLKGEFFIYHETQTGKFLKSFAEKLIENKAVKLFPGCDAEYLYESLFEVYETEYYEILKKAVPTLPIYQVIFADDGSFKIKDLSDV